MNNNYRQGVNSLSIEGGCPLFRGSTYSVKLLMTGDFSTKR